MGYMAQYRITEDHFIISRLKACAATQGINNPHNWVMENIWKFSAQPGWSEAYAVADPEDPESDQAAWTPSAGRDPSVITDEMILTAVLDILSQESEDAP